MRHRSSIVNSRGYFRQLHPRPRGRSVEIIFRGRTRTDLTVDMALLESNRNVVSYIVLWLLLRLFDENDSVPTEHMQGFRLPSGK